MANGRIRRASEWLHIAVAGERQHTSNAQQVAMGTLLFLDLHLSHTHRIDHRYSHLCSIHLSQEECYLGRCVPAGPRVGSY